MYVSLYSKVLPLNCYSQSYKIASASKNPLNFIPPPKYHSTDNTSPKCQLQKMRGTPRKSFITSRALQLQFVHALSSRRSTVASYPNTLAHMSCPQSICHNSGVPVPQTDSSLGRRSDACGIYRIMILLYRYPFYFSTLWHSMTS